MISSSGGQLSAEGGAAAKTGWGRRDCWRGGGGAGRDCWRGVLVAIVDGGGGGVLGAIEHIEQLNGVFCCFSHFIDWKQ